MTSAALPHRADGVPVTIGEPITRPVTGDLLRSSSLAGFRRISADGGSLGPLTVRAASVCGRRHAHAGHTREDAFAIAAAADGTVVVAVADGVGNEAARFSAVGAYVASILSVQLVRSLLDEGKSVDPRDACRRISAAMPTVAKGLILEPFDRQMLATTLITAWISEQGDYRGFAVGDGGVFSLVGGAASPLGPTANGWSNQTEALPDFYTQVGEFVGQLTAGAALLLATDGLSIPLTSPDVAAVLGANWRQPPTLLGFLTDLSFERRGEFDDRTGVAVWYDPGRATHDR